MHPGLETFVWSELTNDELVMKIGDLQRRLQIAAMRGNHIIMNQLNLLLETFYQEQERRNRQQYEELVKASDKNYGATSIDIDWDYGKEKE